MVRSLTSNEDHSTMVLGLIDDKPQYIHTSPIDLD